MTVLVVNDFSSVNGGSSQVALVAAGALAARGHEVILFSAVHVGPRTPPEGVRIVCTGQCEIAHDPVRLRAMVQGCWNGQARRHLGQVLAQLDPARTVVHFHSWTKALSSSVVREAMARGFPTVLTLHDYFIACPNGGLFHYPSGRACTLAPMSAACVASNCDVRSYPQKLWRVARQVVQQRVGGLPDRVRHVVAVSEFSKALLLPHLPEDCRVHVVRNPIDVEPREAARVQAHDEFLVVGRLAPEKGVLMAAQAGRELGAPLTFVGEGPLRDEVQALCPAARITGWLAPNEVHARLRAARALVYPSLLYETDGLAVSEAAAAGLPAVVPDTCAAREAVVDGVTGLWFRSADPRDLLAKLRRLRDEPAYAAALGAAAHERFWRRPHTPQQHAQDLEAVYERVRIDGAHAPAQAGAAAVQGGTPLQG